MDSVNIRNSRYAYLRYKREVAGYRIRMRALQSELEAMCCPATTPRNVLVDRPNPLEAISRPWDFQ